MNGRYPVPVCNLCGPLRSGVAKAYPFSVELRKTKLQGMNARNLLEKYSGQSITTNYHAKITTLVLIYSLLAVIIK